MKGKLWSWTEKAGGREIKKPEAGSQSAARARPAPMVRVSRSTATVRWGSPHRAPFVPAPDNFPTRSMEPSPKCKLVTSYNIYSYLTCFCTLLCRCLSSLVLRWELLVFLVSFCWLFGDVVGGCNAMLSTYVCAVRPSPISVVHFFSLLNAGLPRVRAGLIAKRSPQPPPTKKTNKPASLNQPAQHITFSPKKTWKMEVTSLNNYQVCFLCVTLNSCEILLFRTRP